MFYANLKPNNRRITVNETGNRKEIIDEIVEAIETLDEESVSEIHGDICGGEIICISPGVWEDEDGTRYDLNGVLNMFIIPALEAMSEEELQEVLETAS